MTVELSVRQRVALIHQADAALNEKLALADEASGRAGRSQRSPALLEVSV